MRVSTVLAAALTVFICLENTLSAIPSDDSQSGVPLAGKVHSGTKQKFGNSAMQFNNPIARKPSTLSAENLPMKTEKVSSTTILIQYHTTEPIHAKISYLKCEIPVK